MRLPTAKLDEGRLKFFSRELLVQGQVLDGVAADKAEQAWEEAIAAYQKHLKKILPRLPPGARSLASLSLHDGHLVAGPRSRSGWGWIAVEQGEGDAKPEACLLVYELAGPMRRSRRQSRPPFSPQQVHWLYDELDVTSHTPAGGVHRILLSDGSVVTVPFKDVQIHRLPAGLLKSLTSAARSGKRSRKASILAE